MTELGPNVFRLERKPCRKPDGSNRQIEHGPYVIDESLTAVECGNWQPDETCPWCDLVSAVSRLDKGSGVKTN